jgi:hypothetical protein
MSSAAVTPHGAPVGNLGKSDVEESEDFDLFEEMDLREAFVVTWRNTLVI